MITLEDRIDLQRHLERWKRESRPFIPRDEVSAIVSDFEWMLLALNELANTDPRVQKRGPGRPRKNLDAYGFKAGSRS